MPIARSLLSIAAFLVVFAHVAAGEESHEERLLLRKYVDLCHEVQRQSADNRDMVCSMLDQGEDVVRSDIRNHIAFVCENISRSCNAGLKGAARERYARRSQTLGCKSFGFECPIDGSGGGAQRVGETLGDINVLVEAVAAAERGKFRVPPALKIAILVYVEARDTNREVKKAIDTVNAQLKKFYGDKALGCREDPNYVDDPPPNACTAEIDRQFQFIAVRSVLDWSNGNSVVTQVTRAKLMSWDLDRLKARGMDIPIIVR